MRDREEIIECLAVFAFIVCAVIIVFILGVLVIPQESTPVFDGSCYEESGALGGGFRVRCM